MITCSAKTAILSMDIEDWYHLDYFDSSECIKNYSLLDGIDIYLQILEEHNVPSSFFVLGEIAESLKSGLNRIINNKYDIGSHGWDHGRPITMSNSDFNSSLIKSKQTIENVINTAVEGYRASCFSLNRERLDQVQKAGYFYDSSRIDFGLHPLYENINMDGYELVRPNIFKNNDFFEFQVTTNLVYGKSIPISGGGYLRLLPWYISQRLIKPYLNQGELFILYIHPFELSEKENPPFPASTKWHNKLRFGLGRSSVAKKLSKLINLLKNNGYMFKTFSSFRKELLSQ